MHVNKAVLFVVDIVHSAVFSTFATTQMGKPQCKHGLYLSGFFTKFADQIKNWLVLLCTIDLAAI